MRLLQRGDISSIRFLFPTQYGVRDAHGTHHYARKTITLYIIFTIHFHRVCTTVHRDTLFEY